MFKKIVSIILIIMGGVAFAQKNADEMITLDLNNVKLADALHLISQKMHENWIINPSINTDVTLHFQQVSAKKILMVLMRTHDLVKIWLGNAWYITYLNDWMQHEQEKIKLSEMIETNTPLVIRVFQLHYAKVEDIAKLLQENAHHFLSKRGIVRIDSRTNTLCIQDIAIRIVQIEQLIKKIDVPVKQVMIETRLANVDHDFERDLGFTFSVNPTNNMNGFYSKNRYGLLVAKLADGGVLDMQLSALENQGKAELISSPRLFTANQQTATIESGEEIPYQQESSSGGTTVVFKKAVLSLKVTPQILPGSKVLLQLQINQDKPSKLLIHGIPAINTSQIVTSLLIHDGQTVVLGGIYQTDKEQLRQSIPILSKIPLLGLLFQQNEQRINKRELLIFVTPRIVPV